MTALERRERPNEHANHTITEERQIKVKTDLCKCHIRCGFRLTDQPLQILTLRLCFLPVRSLTHVHKSQAHF